MLRIFLLLAITSCFGFLERTINSTSIAIRHDVDDSRYIDLGSEFPATVRVGERGGDGTLVSAEWVVTAAHVAAGMVRRHGDDLTIFVGDSEFAVAQVIIHPEFKPMGDFDIALIRLAQPVDQIVPARLYTGTDEKGKQIFLVGHGDTKKGTGGDWVADGIRRAATNHVDDVSELHILFDFDDPANPTGVLTDMEGTAGPGDSGGPAYIVEDDKTYLVGVSSRGFAGNNGPGTYGAKEHYVRVSAHASWLRENMHSPPQAKLVNLPDPSDGGTVRRGPGPGRSDGQGLPPGTEVVESIGLIVADRDGGPRMVGRIDELFPTVLLEGGIRPPALITTIDGTNVKNAAHLKSLIDSFDSGAEFVIGFEHNGQQLSFTIQK